MNFNSEDFRTLSDAIVNYADHTDGLTVKKIEKTCKEVYFRLADRTNDYDKVEEQSLVSEVLRECRISYFSMDGVRSIMGCFVFNGFIDIGSCVIAFFRQRDLRRCLSSYKAKYRKDKTLAILTKRYGKIQISVDGITQTLTALQLYRLCKNCGNARTYQFFVVE